MAGIAQPEYDAWLADPTPENMTNVLKALDPVIVTEVQHYAGPKPLLRAKAKGLAITAVKKYDPTKGAALRSWVTTQLKPLSRYSQRMRPVQVSEMASRQAAELYSIGLRMEEDLGREPDESELADASGLSMARVRYLKSHVKPTLTESQLTRPTPEGEEGALPAVIQPNTAQLSADAVYDSLDRREKAIYDWKIGAHGKQQLSNQEIAARLGVTPALISQISERISARIQQVSHAI
jgi:DNA-directed RNA polymerase specialized sigma subunit